MKQSSGISTCLALFFVVLQGYAEFRTKDDNVNIPTYTECGGVIPLIWNDEGASAIVSYKNGTRFGPNEFCVWTFFPEDAAGKVILNFTKNSMENLDGIVVYTWKDSNGITLTPYKIPNGNSELTIEAPHFAVAFSSDGSVESNGFSFEVIVEKAGDGGKNPKAYFSGQNKSEFTYPKDTGCGYYDDNEQVSVVLHGPNATKVREYWLRDLDTEENSDFVNVYKLWSYGSSPPNYEFLGQFSGQESGAVSNSRFSTDDAMLYLFSSDRNGTGRGFTIMWKLQSD